MKSACPSVFTFEYKYRITVILKFVVFLSFAKKTIIIFLKIFVLLY